MRFIGRTVVLCATVCILAAGSACGELAQRINSIIGSPNVRGVSWGVYVVDANSGQELYEHNAHAAMIPASNMKIITTATGLKVLGSDFVYRTQVGLAGDTLVVVGAGDPLLGDEQLEQKQGKPRFWVVDDIADKLAEAGVKRVKDIVVDVTIFDDERVNPSWPASDLNRWYACEVAGLNYNGNCVDVVPEAAGGVVKLELLPPTKYVSIVNKAKAATKGPDTVWCARNPGSNTITVMGRCKGKCQAIRVAIERPGAFFGFLLAEKLTARGIAVDGQLLGQRANLSAVKPLAVYETRLEEVLARCNKDSLGLAAESLLKTVAAAKYGQGSWACMRTSFISMTEAG